MGWVVLAFFGFVGVLLTGIWAVAGVIRGMGGATDVPAPVALPPPLRARLEVKPPGGFQVVNPRPVRPIAANEDGPGYYRVVGVARETSDDVELRIEALTLANAKVKAELKGVIVTAVEKE